MGSPGNTERKALVTSATNCLRGEKKRKEKEKRGRRKKGKANVCFGLKLGLNTPSDEL